MDKYNVKILDEAKDDIKKNYNIYKDKFKRTRNC